MFIKNAAVTGFQIGHFIQTADGAAKTTGTPTCKRLLDGVGAALTNVASYNSDVGAWEIDLDAADMDADLIGLSFTLTDCLPISYTIRTTTLLVDSGTVSANLVQMNDETDPVDNLVLALGNSSGVMISDAAVDAVWNEPISGHLTAGTTGAKLNTASSASGSGSTAYTDTVIDDSSNPLDGVAVWITSDSGGASTVASTTTNTLGSFTVYLDPGTYYLWCARGDINFPNPTTITVT